MQDNIRKLVESTFYAQLKVAYFAVDQDLRVCLATENLSEYGYDQVSIGDSAEDVFEFMTGVSCDMEMELPFVASPSGTPINLKFIPNKGQLAVILSDATVEAENRQQLQQVANENELLVKRQEKLMAKLADASAQLEQKNEQLEEASRLQTGFLSGVSHEFRTPLTSIIGYTELLKQQATGASHDVDFDDESTVENHLKAVQRSSKHLLSLVENLLDHGKLDANEIVIRPKPNNARELFSDVELLLKPLADAKAIGLMFELSFESDVLAILDDSRLRQCLINIIGNAIKFTDEGRVSVKAKLDDGELLVSVRDTGPGIGADDLAKIRLPFYQAADTGKVGTGLGLTITEKIVELMGGQLSIESELGEGTNVSFSILAPLADESIQQDELPASFDGSIRILLAEDDVDIADLVSLLLSETGADVVQVNNGEQAVEALMSQHFDLCLMDIHMPIMSGYQAMAELKKLKNETPIVVMSASAIEADQAQAAAMGCAAYLVKPVDVSDILAIAETVIDTSVK